MYGGADAGDTKEDITVDNFTRKIKDESWAEFMPKGISKEDFNKIKRCFNATRFEESGKKYRALTREADFMHVADRIKQITEIFSFFRNPDKETVLTPWRVVNMHMSDTLGGYCWFDETFDEKTGVLEKPRFVDQGDVTHELFDNVDLAGEVQTKILEINSKTGLYPLYVTYSLYRRRLAEYVKAQCIDIDAVSVQEEQVVWDDIVTDNIYVICNTPMAVGITRRTLFGFREVEKKANLKNEQLIERAANDQEALVKELKSAGFWKGTNSKQMIQFNAVVGNPPYMLKQDETSDDPIYHQFMDLGFEMSHLATFITPGRFLFNAGKTPRVWNNKMLNDDHLKVIWYKSDSSEVFPNVDIKGGIAVTLRNTDVCFGKIGVFTKHNEVSSILKKVDSPDFISLKQLVYAPESYRLSKKIHSEHSEVIDLLSKGHQFDVTTNIFDKLDKYFLDVKPNDGFEYIQIYGRQNNERIFKWIRKDYIDPHENLDTYKVFVAKSNGSGEFGETLTSPIVGYPNQGHTQTFISIGNFKTLYEADACLKYIKTRFARLLLSSLKVTQDNKKETWSNVPVQDFTSNSRIDWSKSINEIDSQLFQLYCLSTVESTFIKENVTSME